MSLAFTPYTSVSSPSYDDILGQTYAIYAIAGAESVIGLGILVAFCRGSTGIEYQIMYLAIIDFTQVSCANLLPVFLVERSESLYYN